MLYVSKNISDYKQYLLDYNWDALYLLNDRMIPFNYL